MERSDRMTRRDLWSRPGHLLPINKLLIRRFHREVKRCAPFHIYGQAGSTFHYWQHKKSQTHRTTAFGVTPSTQGSVIHGYGKRLNRTISHKEIADASRAAWTAGKRSAIKIPMIAMTTRSSTRVKPCRLPPQFNIAFFHFMSPEKSIKIHIDGKPI